MLFFVAKWIHIQARRPEKLFFLAAAPAFVTRILIPRSRKSGHGLLLGCRSSLDAGPFEKTYFWRCSKNEWPKTGKIFTVRFGPASQSIGRGRLSREGALDVRESRERRDKIVPLFLPKNKKKRNLNLAEFGLKFSTFLSRIASRLLFARVEIGVTEFPTKIA